MFYNDNYFDQTLQLNVSEKFQMGCFMFRGCFLSDVRCLSGLLHLAQLHVLQKLHSVKCQRTRRTHYNIIHARAHNIIYAREPTIIFLYLCFACLSVRKIKA